MDDNPLYRTVSGFVAPAAADEFLHEPVDGDHTLSETSYLGFSVPEAGINCMIYHWFHPHLQTTSGGVMVWKGYKAVAGQAEFIDYRNFLPYPEGEIDDIRYPTGVRVRVLEPMAAIRMDFAAEDGSMSFDVECHAIMPAAGRADGTHFTQAMRCRGELVLDGVTHAVDSHYTRDRSYNLPRPETPHPIPPTTWGAAVFGDDLAFHFVGNDGDDGLRWGYVWKHGELRRTVGMRKTTQRAADRMTPVGAVVELDDDAGETHRLEGRGIGNLPMSFWPNMVTHIMLLEYRLDGRVGYGDFQDVQFGHWLRRLPA